MLNACETLYKGMPILTGVTFRRSSAKKNIKSGGTNASQREPHAPRWNAESGERGEKRERGFFSVSNNPYIYISFHLLHVMERLLKRHYIQVVQLSVYTQSGSKKGRWYIRYPQLAFIRQSSRRTHTHIKKKRVSLRWLPALLMKLLSIPARCRWRNSVHDYIGVLFFVVVVLAGGKFKYHSSALCFALGRARVLLPFLLSLFFFCT